jgi:hypothetical protein
MMKKLYLFLSLLVFAFGGCDSGSNSGGGGGGLNMNGNWAGQWAAEVQTSENTVSVQGGYLSANLQLNGRQLTGTVGRTALLGNQPGFFSATISNPNGSGNIELGTIYNDSTSISFHGTYSNNQIYGSFGTPSATSSVVKGNLTLTR